MDPNDIIQITARAFAAGMARFDAMKRPANDLITQAEAKRRFGVTDVMRWKANGLIKPKLRGEGKSTNIWYSIYEIATAQYQEALQRIVNAPAKTQAS